MGDPHHRHRSHVYHHEVGRCVVHLGRRRHGADDITDGERINLIVWNHNLAYRQSRAYTELQQQKRYRKEAAAPDAVCLSYTHDRDYLQYKAPPAAAAKMSRRAWCPLHHWRLPLRLLLRLVLLLLSYLLHPTLGRHETHALRAFLGHLPDSGLSQECTGKTTWANPTGPRGAMA